MPIVSSRSKKARGTPARPSSSTQKASTRRADGSSGDSRPKSGRRGDQRQGDQRAEGGGDREDGAVGAALVAHELVGQAEIADGRGDGDDPQRQLVDAVPLGEDQVGERDLGAEVDPQPRELDGVGGEGRAEDALLGGAAARALAPLTGRGGEDLV